MKVVRNNMVSMDWNADGFIETKSQGFISAVHSYTNSNGQAVPVAFRDGKIYTSLDEDDEVLSFDELVKEIKRAVKSKDSDYPEFYDSYVEIYDSEFENLGFLGLEDCVDDMKARLEDLSGYWEITEVPMGE